MVSDYSIEVINYAKDIDIEFNTKMIVLFTLLAYCLVMFYISFKMEDNTLWRIFLKYILFRWATLPYIILFFIPLMMVYRGVPLESIFMLILAGYTILFVFGSLLFTVFGAEWIMTFFGVDDLGDIIKAGFNKKFTGKVFGK